ncbi:LysR family transcriptional regulator [Limosilactobacillus sp. RRLNB_1_1]|uniref:LysR family transcriptional regulator n=1 Tax=Limosilactobacillus albertensis TaxID=2759752 RepID=A0A7W3TSE8_9LACO|nr:LysR family transcriptional regulator [Limosilactobacillus albertensis]MBB1069816.1 LysR family transcriptional regulator [Limosilactobacillus albertensis]MCD7117054.1 LysR family transcriptional regulator [Limosilactobacillus albertensis]MCD7128658.1 LysR family transcriptional regulator [Limosilactobacillus albertensis]
MEIEQLENFLAVSQLGSFQKVAEQKFISQRTVSKQMTNLENELGIKLFFRGSNKILLTQAGTYFAQRANELINQLNDSIGKLHAITNSNLQHLRLGYFSPFEGRLLVTHLKKYQALAKHKPINFHVTEGSVEHLFADVTLGNLDCAYILDYGTHDHLLNSELNNTILTEGEMVLGISKDHPLAAKKELSATDLTGQTILYYSNESSTYLQSAFLATLPQNHHYNVQRVGTIEQMQTLVALGQAIAFYPQSLPVFPNEWIVFRRLHSTASDASQRYSIRLIYRPDNNINGLKYFRQFLNNTINHR